MQGKSEGSISYERENPALAANNADGRQLPGEGVGTRNIESKKKEYSPEEHIRDVNSRTIFSNRELTCQFLRDYTDLPIFSDLRPEDIEDVTDRYKAFLGVEFEADTVKKVRVRVPEEDAENRRETASEGEDRKRSFDGEERRKGTSGEGRNSKGRFCEREVFVIPLIEHKTRVDYDVAMQLLRYMAVIWYDYKKQQESLKEGSSGRRSFRYPPIIPIVYYEGRASWTAGMHLADRIDLSLTDELAGYIPDFTYKVVRVHEYGNEELKKKHNEMSLVMMINRIQSPEDYVEFLDSSREYMDEIYSGTSEDIRKVYQEVLWSLLQKMNVPAKEAREKLAEMEENGMGILFADMEKMDIQAERLNTKLAREEADAAKKALEELKRRTAQKMNSIFSQLVSLCQGEKMSREETVTCLQERYKLSAEDAVSAVEQFWNH